MSYLSLGDNNDDDGDFFGSPVGAGQSQSRLGSLFGMNAQMDKNPTSNQSLTYTAPKPPRPEKPTSDVGKKNSQPQPSSGIAVACAVTAYKYVNNQYQKQGKLGAALLTNFADKDYKILMYVSKQQPVTTAKITSEFQFNIQPNNYASFYDDQRQMWSVLFDSSDHIVNFAKQVCLAKYNTSQNSNNAVVTQELLLGEQDTQPLKSGDSVEAKYTGWLFQSQTGTLGSVFDSNHKTEKTFRFKTGKGKVIKGWEEGMLGLKKGGRRFLVIPPSLAYGSKGAGNRVPPDSTLAFEVDILRIKHQNGDNSVQQSNSVESVPQAVTQSNQAEPSFGQNLNVPFAGMPTPADAAGDETVKGRTASFNEQLTHGNPQVDSNKAKLLSRMAKVGQPMLPPQPAAASQPPHETDSTPVQSGAPHVQPHSVPQPQQSHVASVSHTPPQQTLMQMQTREMSQSPAYPAVSPSPVAVDQPYMHNPHTIQHAVSRHSVSPHSSLGMMQTNPVVGQFQHPANMLQYAGIPQTTFHQLQQYPAQPGSDYLPALLSESQKQTLDMKVLLEKMEKVSDKVTEMMKSSESQRLNLSSADNMDAALLSHNIQRIIQENDKMKKKVLEKNKQIETQSDKIADLLQQNQKLVEESHAQMEKRNTSFKETFGQTQERTLQLEKEKVELTSKLSDATSKICELQLNLVNMTDRANSFEKLVKTSSSDAQDKQNADQIKYQEMENQLSETVRQLEMLQSDKLKLEKSYQEKSLKVDDQLNQKLETAQQSFLAEKNALLQKIEDLQENHKKQIQNMQNKSQAESSNADELKNELESRWREKCKEAVATVTKAAEDKLNEVSEEKDKLVQKLEAYQTKFLQLRGMYEEKVQSEDELTEKLEALQNIKERYDKLRQQAVVMKEKYEEKIAELKENSQDDEKSEVDLTSQIKSVMNDVYRQINSEISSDGEYTGSEVMSAVLKVIKSTTLKMLQPTLDQTEQSDSESEEEEEQEETEDIEKDGDQEREVKDDEDVSSHNINSEMENPSKEEVAESVIESRKDSVLESSEKPEDEGSLNDEDQDIEDERKQADETNSAVKEEEPQHAEEVIIQKDESVAEISEVQSQENNETVDEDFLVEQNQPDKIDNEKASEFDSNEVNANKERASSPDVMSKPSPPPLFDDDEEEDDDDSDWLK